MNASILRKSGHLVVVLLAALSMRAVAVEAVLSGYQPIQFDEKKREAKLYERTYSWGGMLPSSITSRGLFAADSIQLKWRDELGERVLAPEKVNVIENTPARLVIETVSRPSNTAEIQVTTALEYDGFATVSLVVNRFGVAAPAELWLETRVARRNSHVALAYRAETMRMRDVGRVDVLGQDDVLSVPYAGDFLNVINFADGDRSFWWFADNAEGWDWGLDNPTAVRMDGSSYVMIQNFIGRGASQISSRRIQFGLLATPVRPMKPDWRLQRMTGWLPTAEDKELSAKIFSYWEKGLAYDALPYASYPSRVLPRLPLSDRQQHPGVASNRALVRKNREQLGAELLPYYPLHLLSEVDPVVVANRRSWEMYPPEVWSDMVGGYPIRYPKPQISLRAPGVADHILEGLSKSIDELDVNGFYFDHGMVRDSNNPANGAWVDCKGKTRGSLDIWAMRDFFKRLQTAFQLRGKPGIVIVHNSNREIIPVYTFAYGMLDGEQFRPKMKNGDYLLQTSLSQFRAKFSSHQYGIPTYWLPVEWVNHERDKNWVKSDDARAAYRKMMGLALLHDVLDWPHTAHPSARKALLTALDNFGIAQSDFYGYWSEGGYLYSVDPDVVISRYVNEAKNETLHVVYNSSLATKNARLKTRFAGPAISLDIEGGGQAVIKGGGEFSGLVIPGRQFLLIRTPTIKVESAPLAPSLFNGALPRG